MVGAVLVKRGEIIGQGWHHRAGAPHAEIEALRQTSGSAKGATLYVTLEPCSTHGRTPPCTDAILAAGINRAVVAAVDPNPAHQGRGLEILRRAGLSVSHGLLAEEAQRLNEAFNHWIVHRTPLVTVKAAMSLDGKIATRTGESKWISGPAARRLAMRWRAGSDAILVGVNTIIADNPNLTVRLPGFAEKKLRRIVLDPTARIPLTGNVVSDEFADRTTIVVTPRASDRRIRTLEKRVRVMVAPETEAGIDLRWLLRQLGSEEVMSVLVEGGGETNASFLLSGLAQRVAFIYAPLVLGGRTAPKAVAGGGILELTDRIRLANPLWRKLGNDLLLTARLEGAAQMKN
jgi:diaminohydroxyphosphoribosylaminopyrimidine deaminase/5-amino-6-(5-phosphoribosylamino)uracil reductase